MNDMDTAEVLAQQLTLEEINWRLKILDKIIRDDQAAGGERWKTTAAPQAERLNEARALLLKKAGHNPESTVIVARVGHVGAKGKK